jgi:S-formylglutathione hydrolase FrmB
MKRNDRILKLALFCLAFCMAVSGSAVYAQTSSAVPNPDVQNRATVAFVRKYNLESKLMARQMPYNLIVPEGYDYAANKSKKYPVIYLLHGLTGHFNNWAENTKLSEFAYKYQYIIVMPEGNDGWYTDSATVEGDKYESYIVRELIPEIDKNFRTISERNSRAIAGLSMGGYGSLKFGLKYPEMFSLVGSFSGALGAPTWTDSVFGNWKALRDSVRSVYAEEGSKTRAENDIYKIVREIPAEKQKNLPFIYLDCGTEDFLIRENRDFAALLFEKKIPHEFRQLPGKHDWNYWNSQVEEFLELSEKHLGQNAGNIQSKAKAN